MNFKNLFFIMKSKCLLFTLFLCCSTMVFGTEPPEYIPMVVSGNQWNELAQNGSVVTKNQYQKTYVTVLTAETHTCDTLLYYVLLTAKDESSSDWLENGYIREDMENRKVYYKPQKDDQEILLYDFNLFDMQVGNEIQSYDLQTKTNISLIVENVEYKILGGENRMVATLRSTSIDDNYPGSEEHVWIEGIGNMDGFLRSTVAQYAPGSESISLLCFSQNEKLVYKPLEAEQFFDGCFIYRVPFDDDTNIKNLSSKSDKVSFDAANRKIVIDVSSQNHALSLELLDAQGKVLLKKTELSNKSFINVSNLSNGIYLYRLTSEGMVIFADKLLIYK